MEAQKKKNKTQVRLIESTRLKRQPRPIVPGGPENVKALADDFDGGECRAIGAVFGFYVSLADVHNL